MDDFDENTIEVLNLSQEIVELIELNIQKFTPEESDDIVTTNETIQFFLEQDDIDRALAESITLKEYLLKITSEI
tara:strand:+ start:1039 stop:1263 length:225 start_codon:yes stop_codon:yes gene_type:complete